MQGAKPGPDSIFREIRLNQELFIYELTQKKIIWGIRKRICSMQNSIQKSFF